jgi:hypothetical protein
MGFKLNARTADVVRKRIQCDKLIERLQKHVHGELELSQTQIQAAKILLDKSLSNAPTDMNVSAGAGLIDVLASLSSRKNP